MPSFSPVRVTAPATLPVTLAEAKAHLRVEHGDEDVLIQAFIAAATERLDGWAGVLGRCLMLQTWRQDFDGFAPMLRLPLHPVAAVSQVAYVDTASANQIAASSLYDLLRDDAGDYVALKPGQSWPATGVVNVPVSITFTAGEAAAPAPIRAAILLMVGDLYANRETAVVGVSASAVPMSVTVEHLLAPYRRQMVA